MLRKVIYSISLTLILATPSLAAGDTIAGLKRDTAIIVGIGVFTIITVIVEMLVEVANKGKIKLYIGIISTLMVLGTVIGYFLSALAAIYKASKMF